MRSRGARDIGSGGSERPTRPSRIIGSILGLSRGVRMLLVVLVALSCAALMIPAVDALYLQYFYTENTRVLPSLLSAAAGIMVYVAGWWLLVGTVGEAPPLRPAALGFIVLGLFCLVLTIVLLAYGLLLGTAPT